MSVTQLQGIQTAVDNEWAGGSFPLKQLIATTYHYIGSIVTDQQSSTGLQATNVGFTPSAGGGPSGVAVPRQVCGVISLHVQDRYRGGKGRIYIPGIDTTNVNADGKTLVSSTLPVLVGYINSMNAALTVLGAGEACVLCILRARTQVIPHTVPKTYVPPFFNDVVAVTCSGVLGTQRRRIRKVAHT
jgi:hypothetical protein